MFNPLRGHLIYALVGLFNKIPWIRSEVGGKTLCHMLHGTIFFQCAFCVDSAR